MANHLTLLRDDTRAIPAVRVLPPVPAVARPPVESRLARRARMLARSPFARHLTAAATGIVDGTWFLLWTAAAGLGVAAFLLGFTELAQSFFRAIGR